MSVARRPVDRHTRFLQFFAGRINIIDRKRQMAEIAPACVSFGVPIIGEFDERPLRRFGHLRVAGAARKTKVKRPFSLTMRLISTRPELAAIEIERLIEVRDADHSVEIFHLRTCRGLEALPFAGRGC